MILQVDRLISICWEKTLTRLGSQKDFIYVTGVFDLIHEIEEFIGATKIFTDLELSLLRRMAQDKPVLRLYKQEVLGFLLRLVHFSSFEKFLQERAKTSPRDLSRLVENYTLYHKKHDTEPLELKYNFQRAKVLSAIEPKIEPETTRFGRWFGGKTNDTFYRKFPEPVRAEPSEVPFEDPMFSRNQQRKITELEESFRTLQTYTTSLENRLKMRSNDSQLEAKILAQEKKIQQLELMCDRYEREFSKTNGYQRRTLSDLGYEFKAQHGLLTKLKRKFVWPTKAKVKSYIWTLPFINWMYDKYQNEYKNFGMWVINAIALALVFVLVMNGVKLLYYVVLLITKIVNLWSTRKDEEPIAYSWVQQTPWLEYWLYRLNDFWE